MGILNNAILGVLHVAIVADDLALMFLVVHLLHKRLAAYRGVAALHEMGRPWIEAILDSLDRGLSRACGRPLRREAVTVIGLMGLGIVRIGLSAAAMALRL